MKPLHWGLLASGRIAEVFARGVLHSKLGRLAAVGSRSLASAEAFASKLGIPRAHGSYEELLADPTVEAVYIATPHTHHAEWVIKAAEAGKHILCEKPFALNHAEAMAAVEAARANDVLVMEAFMYRCHPVTAKLVELIRSGAIGEVRLIRANFSFQAAFNPDSRLFNNALGGGGILDVGCYTTSMARLLAGAALGQPFASPLEVSGSGSLLETGVDGWAVGSLKFPGNILAQISTGVQLNMDNGVTVFGSAGRLSAPNCWIPGREGGEQTITLAQNGQPETAIVIPDAGWLYSLEADAFAEALIEGLRSVPAMPIEDTLDNMLTLDRWRNAIGLTYEAEKPGSAVPTVTRRPLARKARSPMRYGRVAGIETEISRLVMGCDNQRTMPHAAALFDDFYERGGNAFDTAWLYSGGLPERLLGHWMRTRGLRREIMVLGKGGHSPLCEPKHITWQLEQTLERLQTDYVDLYLLHRDNPEIPAGEFVEALNEHLRQGRIRAFGGSNWSIARVAEANAYAHEKGLVGFAALSNNFSLARMMNPVWGGCVSASDPESKRWLQQTGTAHFAWSSQARGFFTDRAGRDKLTDEELVRCWYSEENFLRRDRAIELARAKGAAPINIALAFVLHQKFQSFALIGPRTIAETVSCFAGLEVQLSDAEIEWLNLERD